MSTHAKLFTVAAVALIGGLLVGFFPIHVSSLLSSADCGSAFLSDADDYLSGRGQELCEGRLSMMRYPAIALLAIGVVAGIWAFYAQANSEKWDPIK